MAAQAARQVAQPDGSTVDYDAAGHALRQLWPDGRVTTFQYRGEQYVATTGDQHVLYDANGHEIKQWQGNDESSASQYHQLGNGHYTLTEPDGDVAEYNGDGGLVRQVADGRVTTFQYRGEQYVATTGNQHVLYDANGNEIKHWEGGDESQASFYHKLGNGNYTLTDPKNTVTEYTTDGQLVRQTTPDGQVTTFQYRGEQYVASTGNQHVLYDANGNEVKQWEGGDESQASFYHKLGNGNYTLTDPKNTVTEYTTDGQLVRQTAPDGKVTTFQYRGEQYVATTGNQHVLYDANGNEVKQWEGNDESKAEFYRKLDNGNFTLTGPDGTVTEYNANNQPIRIQAPGKETQTILWQSDGGYIVTQGDLHSKYDSKGVLLETWTGDNQSLSDHYTYTSDGNLIITGPDGTTTYGADGKPTTIKKPDGTEINWRVDLELLNTTVATLEREKAELDTRLQKVTTVFTNIQTAWESPASKSFALLSTEFDKAKMALQEAQGEAIRRMRASYRNYVESENQNSYIISQINKEGHKLAGGAGGAT